MFKTKSGAVKLQVLITPAEYRELRAQARKTRASISAYTRARLFQHDTFGRKYQPRGFARKGA